MTLSDRDGGGSPCDLGRLRDCLCRHGDELAEAERAAKEDIWRDPNWLWFECWTVTAASDGEVAATWAAAEAELAAAAAVAPVNDNDYESPEAADAERAARAAARDERVTVCRERLQRRRAAATLAMAANVATHAATAPNLRELQVHDAPLTALPLCRLLVGFDPQHHHHHQHHPRLALPAAAAGPQLTTLSLKLCGLTSADLWPLLDWLSASGRGTLTTLDLSCNQLDAAACPLLQAVLPRTRVRSLLLRSNPVCTEDDNVRLMALFVCSRDLHSLDLGFCGLGDGAIVKMCTVLQSPACHVADLNVDGANVTTQRIAGLLLDTVAALPRMRSLSTRFVALCAHAVWQDRLAAAIGRHATATGAAPPTRLQRHHSVV